QGKAAGVYVSTNSGQPGDAAVIRIRGFGTVNNNDPLYVVDGQLFNDINNVNPNDIQNIEVLKDASATAIYGSRGANGVILVTTKRARNGESIASFDSYVGAKTNYNPPVMQNSAQFYDFIKTAYANSNQTLDPKFTKQYEKGNDTDWWKEISQTGLSQNYNFNIRNGGEKSRTYFSLGYLSDKGAIKETDFERISLKFNGEYDLSSHITVGTNIGIAKNKTRNTSSLPRFDFLLQADPFTPVINPLVPTDDPQYEYNKYAPTEWAFNPNPVSTLMLNDRSSKDINLYGNVYGRVKLFDGLSYYVQYNFEHNNNRYKAFLPIYKSTFSDINLANQESKYNNVTQLTQNTNYVVRSVIEQRLNYYKIFGKHTIDAMAGMTYDDNNAESINGFKTGAPGNDPAFRVFDAATTGVQLTGRPLQTAILSYFGRLNYVYSDRYLLTVNFRADGSSILKNNQWGYFPSFSLGWRLNNEDFFKKLNIDNTVSNLKIRGGWGRVGNQNINAYAASTLIGTNIENQFNFGSGYSQGYVPTNNGNPDIKWETTEQTNIGLDAGMFNDRLTFSADYFVKKTRDMLLQVPIPVISGFVTTPFRNAGNLENKGFEFTANYRNNFGKLSFAVGGNVSFYKNKITGLDEGNRPIYGAVSKTELGGPMSRFFGYVWEGVFQNQAEIDAYTGPQGKIQPNATPGDFKFADLDGSGVIDDKDRTYIGNPHPDMIYGFNLNLAYGGFDFSAFFQGTVGNDLWNNLKSLSSPGASNSIADAYTQAWFKEGDDAKYPKPSLLNANQNYRASSWWVEKGSFLRLQNVQLGYNLPA
ncbi:MAG: SusC/RagA family TonB-linked outer membrane protein, partial [Sphingobacteriaceae bacterium]